MKRKNKYIAKSILSFVLVLSMVFGLIPGMPMSMVAQASTTTSTITVGGTDYTLFTGFTATGGNGTNYANLVDGNTSTIWMAHKKLDDNLNYDFTGGTDDPAFVEFHADEAFIPKGYVLTYDNSVNENWKPTSWALKAKLSENDGWTTIHSSNTSLSNGSHFEIACTNDGDNKYQYFRFEVYDVGTTYMLKLNELQFYGSLQTYTHLTAKAATCTETGIKQDCYRRNSDGKYFTDETGTTELAESDVIAPIIPHTGVHHEATDVNIEYWQCSMCSKYFSNEGCTTEITEEQTKIYRTITIDNSISGLVTSNVNQALAGATVTLTVSHLIDVSTLQVNNGSVTLTDAGNGTYTFTVPTTNVTVTASTSTTYAVNLPTNMEIVSATNAADANGKYITGTTVTFMPVFGYVATNVSDGTNTLEPDASGIYTVTVADADINITANIESSNTLYLATAASDFTAVDGNILIGSTSHTVTIANGANITLNNATITGGIVCDGTATITLVGTNSVSGWSGYDSNIAAVRYSAGIQIGGSGTTLTINGNGTLTATGGYEAAGIGLNRAWNVTEDVVGGNIVINGGTITANGGTGGAGIGAGVTKDTQNSSSRKAIIGNITITGGTVTAVGGTNADGIGAGQNNYNATIQIGTVTIYDGIDKVDASSIKDFGNVVYMHGENDVTASKTDYFTIGEDGNRRLIVQKPVIAEIADQTYTGSAITPEPTVIAGSLSLTKGTDYAFSYTNNTNVGTATVRATFQGTYASLGYVERTFTIVPSTIMVSVAGSGTVTIGDKSASNGEAFGVMSEKGASVVLTLAPESGNTVRSVEYGYTNNSGTTASGLKLPISGTTATLTVPDNLKDGTGVTVNVTFAPALNGGADEASAVALMDATVTDLGGGWYKVENDITFDHTLNLLADTYLTLGEGKTMTVNTATDRGIDSDYTLTVSGAGALSVTATGTYDIAIRVGNYVQTGATVTASGYIGIRCKDNFEEFNVTNDFTFSGGQLTVTGTSDGIWADNTITISCTNGSDFIQSSSYEVLSGGTIKVADGKALTDGMNIYTGTLTSAQISAIAGKQLVKKTYEISFVKGDDDASGSMESETVYAETDYTLPACGFTAPDGKVFKEWSVVIGEAAAESKAPSDTITVTANTTVTAVWEDDTRIGKISSAKVHLWNDISVMMFATFTEEPSSASMVVTMNGNETNITGSKVEDKKYSFTFAGICPEYIGDSFSAVMTYVVNGQTYTDTLEDYSVKKYCMTILKMSDSDLEALIPSTATVEETRRMAVDVLYYGAEAQNYMNHNTGNLATKDLTSAQAALASTYVTPTSNEGVVETKLSGTRNDNYYWYSAKANLDNAATLQFYFMAPNGIDGLKVEINNEEYAIHQTSTSGKYYVEITQMSAGDFGKKLTAVFKLNGTETGQAFSYSMNTYVSQVEDHATFGSLAKRLYNYGKSAYNYAH